MFKKRYAECVMFTIYISLVTGSANTMRLWRKSWPFIMCGVDFSLDTFMLANSNT